MTVYCENALFKYEISNTTRLDHLQWGSIVCTYFASDEKTNFCKKSYFSLDAPMSTYQKGTLKDTVQLNKMNHVSCNRSISDSTAERRHKKQLVNNVLLYVAFSLPQESYPML